MLPVGPLKPLNTTDAGNARGATRRGAESDAGVGMIRSPKAPRRYSSAIGNAKIKPKFAQRITAGVQKSGKRVSRRLETCLHSELQGFLRSSIACHVQSTGVRESWSSRLVSEFVTCRAQPTCTVAFSVPFAQVPRLNGGRASYLR